MANKMNILVTGGAGFIGSHLVERLLNDNHSVTVIDNLSTASHDGFDVVKNSSASFRPLDITNEHHINGLFDNYQFDCVFHLAAQINLRTSFEKPDLDAKINILGSLNIINNCIKHKVKKIIFSSSGGAIYSSMACTPYIEISKIDPGSPYGLSKFIVEKYLEIFENKHNLNYTCLRYGNVYGPRQNSKSEAGVISIFFQNAKQNRDLCIFGDGKQTRDFVYVDDVVEANVVALRQDIRGSFNVATGVQTDVNKLANDIIKITGSSSNIVHQDPIVGELLHSCLSYDKLNILTGWKPKYNIDQGIQLTANYWK